jgi:hypothetical protein
VQTLEKPVTSQVQGVLQEIAAAEAQMLVRRVRKVVLVNILFFVWREWVDGVLWFGLVVVV